MVLSHSTLAHLPQFLLGIVCGWALLTLRSRQSAADEPNVLFDVVFWTATAAAIAMAAVPALAIQPPYARYLFPLLPLFICAAIVTVPFAPLASRVLEFAPIRGLGTISYGVYVYHMLCLTAIARFTGTSASGTAGEKTAFALAGLALTIVVATASYLVMERPLLTWNARRSAR
jgi:peptidoglycan/LPS O-acetylase OafA/YrhL